MHQVIHPETPMQLRSLFLTSALVLSATAVSASPITPTFTSFGTLASATFGGSGIPNDAVAALTTLGNGVTLGLTAHQRYDNPALGNDNNGTFFARPGVDTHAPSPTDPYATWNFAFYVDAGTGNYSYKLFYDFDPAIGNDQGGHGSITFGQLTGVSQ